LNQVVHDVGETKLFVTMIAMILDPAAAEVRYSNAGHFEPRLRSVVEGSVVKLEGAGAPPLGMFLDTVYETALYPLAAGDTLFFFTDGFVEARGPNGELFGEPSLDLAIAHGPSRAEEILKQAVAATEYFMQSMPASDDMTALALSYLPRSRS